ncbi:hypothetical protein ACWF9G_04620 [Nocardia sp. NPDC055029]
MSGKFRATAAALAIAPMIALGSGMATAEPAPAPVPVPISVPASVAEAQPVFWMIMFPWNFLTCIPAFSAGIIGYFACVA